ncbi:MAG: hypothetical protein IAA97_09320 [Spirochaetes bacterium]|uniref:Uncharacterized protein n=1 Tax=Candidatus Ornithospirochaeta stercoripullorum TaxID=2840899 RepID=A0A9D9E2U5_9SPIO|nr:hypothetical protein [Candidatus Ornithospirochaeta stercoripullorum]
MNWHISELEHGYITRYLITQPLLERVHGEPVAITEESNVWIGSTAASTHENPVRVSFLKKLQEKGIKAPRFTLAEPEGNAIVNGNEAKVLYKAPFGDPVIGASLFSPVTRWLSLAAYIVLDASEEGAYSFLLSVEGGMSIFSDDKEIFSFRPYKRNETIETTCTLNLKKGENILIVEADEFAERDTELAVSFKLISGKGHILQKVPMGDRNTALIMEAERAMESLAFDRSTFTSGHITCSVENPFTDRDLIIHMSGATEENEALGLLKTSDAIFKKGSCKADLGAVETFPVGFLRMNVWTEIEGVVIRTVRTFENFPFSFEGKTSENIDERRKEAWRYLSLYGEGNANRAMALLFTNGDKDEIERILRAQLDFINKRSDCSDFYISYFPFMIRHFSSSGLIRKETLQDMENCLLSFRYWHDEPGNDAMWFWSENHALMFHVSELIAGEMYPDRIFTNSGMTGKEKQEKALSMLRPWFETFFREGFTEWNSPPYLPIDILGFASLYAQTENSEMKENARKALEYVFRLLAITSYEGIFSTTSGRTYLKELMGNYSNCPSFINWIGYGIGNESHAGKGSVPVLMSMYEPEEGNLRYHRIEEGKALSWKSTHGYKGYANVTVYKTSGYLLSAANDFNPGRRGFQEDVIHAVLGAEAHVWITHPGEFALYGQARPSYWAGSGTLPRVNQYKGFASAIWQVSSEHPVDFTHAYFPLFAFKRTLMKEGWAFAENEHGGMIAITAAGGITMTEKGPNKERELVSPGKKNIWIIRCSDIWKEKSFESFVSRIISSAFAYNPDDLSYRFDDAEYGTIEASWNKSLSVNGNAENYEGYTPSGTVTIEDLQ